MMEVSAQASGSLAEGGSGKASRGGDGGADGFQKHGISSCSKRWDWSIQQERDPAQRALDAQCCISLQAKWLSVDPKSHCTLSMAGYVVVYLMPLC